MNHDDNAFTIAEDAIAKLAAMPGWTDKLASLAILQFTLRKALTLDLTVAELEEFCSVVIHDWARETP